MAQEIDVESKSIHETRGSDIVKLLMEIQEENTTISELQTLEESYVKDLSNTIGEFMKDMNILFTFSKEAIRETGIDASKISITPDSEVRILGRSGRLTTMTLADMPTNLIIPLVKALLPRLKELQLAHRSKMSDTRGVLKMMVKELKDVITPKKP